MGRCVRRDAAGAARCSRGLDRRAERPRDPRRSAPAERRGRSARLACRAPHDRRPGRVGRRRPLLGLAAAPRPARHAARVLRERHRVHRADPPARAACRGAPRCAARRHVRPRARPRFLGDVADRPDCGRDDRMACLEGAARAPLELGRGARVRARRASVASMEPPPPLGIAPSPVRRQGLQLPLPAPALLLARPARGARTAHLVVRDLARPGADRVPALRRAARALPLRRLRGAAQRDVPRLRRCRRLPVSLCRRVESRARKRPALPDGARPVPRAPACAGDDPVLACSRAARRRSPRVGGLPARVGLPVSKRGRAGRVAARSAEHRAADRDPRPPPREPRLRELLDRLPARLRHPRAHRRGRERLRRPRGTRPRRRAERRSPCRVSALRP